MRSFAVLLVAVLVGSGCGSTARKHYEPPATAPAPAPAPVVIRPGTTESPRDTTVTSVTPTTPAAGLGALQIDDHPHGPAGYRRDDWPTWLDPDHNGCDAREDALIAASTTPVTRGAGCHVTAGHWVSAYDGFQTDRAGDIDIDHVVPLEAAHEAGGWSWLPDRRAAYANDQGDLWAVSASSNRAKGAKTPDRWRPPFQGVWCEYATRWIEIKVRWQLTATTAERDALGQMEEMCP